MVNITIEKTEYFIVGKGLPPDCPSYVERPADAKLLNLASEGEFCCVFSPNQMGKSSLMARTAWRLNQQGVRAVTVDLSKLDLQGSVDQAFLALLGRSFEID